MPSRDAISIAPFLTEKCAITWYVMLQLGARFYWPEVGRFVQQDPMGGGVNWYSYGAGNPLANIDPDGQAWQVVVAVVLVVVIVAEIIICALQGHQMEPHIDPTVPYVPPPPAVPVGAG